MKKYSKLLLIVSLLLPLSSFATTLSQTTGTSLSDIGISGYSTNRIYLYFDGIDETATTFPATGHSTYICGSAYGSGEGAPNNPTDARDLWDNLHGGSGPNGPAGGSCPGTVDSVGIYWVNTTDTGSYMEWDSFEITSGGGGEEGTSTPIYGEQSAQAETYATLIFVTSISLALYMIVYSLKRFFNRKKR